jgi:hypothetical protein
VRLSWRAAWEMVGQGIPVVPIRDGAPVRGEEPTLDPAQIGIWVLRHRGADAGLDLARAGLLAVVASRFEQIAAVFDREGWWPEEGSFTMQGPGGSWAWIVRQPVPRMPSVDGPWGALGVRIEADLHPAPGAVEHGEAWRLEADAGIVPGNPPQWLRGGLVRA